MEHMDQTRTSSSVRVSEPPAEPANCRTAIVCGDVPAAEPDGGCFDCNICLDSAADPVVTLCGHLYCWPCIYEWLRPDADAESRSSAGQRCCPVCKAAVTPDALVPLYGRDNSSRPKKPLRCLGGIPLRSAVRLSAREGDHLHRHQNLQTDQPTRVPRQTRHYPDAAQFDFLFPAPFGDRSMMHSTAGGVLGGMAMAVMPWMLRGQQQSPSMYFPSPYRTSPNQRRRHMEVERSLHQIWFFLFVFVLLCLLLF